MPYHSQHVLCITQSYLFLDIISCLDSVCGQKDMGRKGSCFEMKKKERKGKKKKVAIYKIKKPVCALSYGVRRKIVLLA